MTEEEAKIDALQKHPDCSHAEIYNGLSLTFQLVWVVKLWRNAECFYNDDPPKYVVDGYPAVSA